MVAQTRPAAWWVGPPRGTVQRDSGALAQLLGPTPTPTSRWINDGIAVQEWAATVQRMIFLLLGVAAGAAVALGLIPGMEIPAAVLTDYVTRIGIDLIEKVLNHRGADHAASWYVVISTVVMALTPGIIAGVLMGCARSGPALRRAAALLAALAGIWVFVAEPGVEGALVAGALVLVALIFAFVVSTVVSFTAAAVSTIICIAQIRLFMLGDENRFALAASTLADVAHVGDAQLWSYVLAGGSIALPVAVLWAALTN